MGRSRVETVASEFWERAGGRARFGVPVDIAAAASIALPVSVAPIPSLSTSVVRAFLHRIGASPWIDGSPRPLRGCLIADSGHALILVDANDEDDEQRVTVAHEVAHLLIHYFEPRSKAVEALGKGILAVLDRVRPPTHGERLSSALTGVPIEPFRHAMERGAPRHSVQIAAMEDDADSLAIELLAPWRDLRSEGALDPSTIRRRFGLPQSVAVRLATSVAPQRTSMGVLGIFGKK